VEQSFVKMTICDAGLKGLLFKQCENVRKSGARSALDPISKADFRKARTTLLEHCEMLAAKPPVGLAALISCEVATAASRQIPPLKPSPKPRRRSKA
jgi:hypothetical protein